MHINKPYQLRQTGLSKEIWMHPSNGAALIYTSYKYGAAEATLSAMNLNYKSITKFNTKKG